jgi:RimJ/RimL family protein N-acetyltransferase
MTSSVSHHPWPMRVGPLVLREAGEEDIEQLLSLRNDPGVNRFMLRTSVDAATFRQEWGAVPTSDTDFSCVAEVEGRVVAMGFLDVVDGAGQPGMPKGTEGVIGYIVEPSSAGRGVATCLASGLLTAAFDRLGLRRVTASCNADNPASARVLEKAGMRRERHGVEDSWHDELGWVDSYQYAILAREWSVVREEECR